MIFIINASVIFEINVIMTVGIYRWRQSATEGKQKAGHVEQTLQVPVLSAPQIDVE